LRTTIIQLRHELTSKENYAAKLELVLHQRLENHRRIARQARTGKGAEPALGPRVRALVEMVRLSPEP
jgi:hypothetical protein